jgi:hypothetical protein
MSSDHGWTVEVSSGHGWTVEVSSGHGWTVEVSSGHGWTVEVSSGHQGVGLMGERRGVTFSEREGHQLGAHNRPF